MFHALCSYTHSHFPHILCESLHSIQSQKTLSIKNFNGDLAVHCAIQSMNLDVARMMLLKMKSENCKDYVGFRHRTRKKYFFVESDFHSVNDCNNHIFWISG